MRCTLNGLNHAAATVTARKAQKSVAVDRLVIAFARARCFEFGQVSHRVFGTAVAHRARTAPSLSTIY